MSTTQPIRNQHDIYALENFYLSHDPNMRNYAMIKVGINTALRISDLLSLTWNNVYDFNKNCFRTHITIVEKKTKKLNRIAINKNVIQALTLYRSSILPVSPNTYLFCGRNPSSHLSRSQAYRIIKRASQLLHLPDNISCHSLRKTFGYHAWHAGVNPALLMYIYNHSSFQVTKRYLGIEQDDKDNVFLNINL